MLRINADGTADLDFERADGSVFTVTVKRPKFGQFKRLRSDARKALRDGQEWLEQAEKEAAEAPEGAEVMSSEERLERFEELMGESTIAWWTLVLLGDDSSFAGLAMPGEGLDSLRALTPDEWPSYLVHGYATEDATGPAGQALVAKTGSAQILLNAWQEVPLARGGKP